MDRIELIEEVIDLIKEESVYKNYQKSQQRLEKEDIKEKLLDYKRLKETYLMYPYSISKIELDKMETEISLLQEVRDYEQAYQELNQYLEEIKQVLFKGMVENED